jgi:hypothetical protein
MIFIALLLQMISTAKKRKDDKELPLFGAEDTGSAPVCQGDIGNVSLRQLVTT